jgi:hypothetical protein
MRSNFSHSPFGLRWFAFRDDAYAELASDWLNAEGIKPVWLSRGGAT